MTEIVQMDPSQYEGTREHVGDVKAQSSDTQFRSLLALSILFLITAVAVTIYALLLRFLPALNLPRLEAAPAAGWPAGLSAPAILGIGLALVAALFYLLARSRILHNRSMQASAGCPSCHKHELLRISRTRRDRLITLSSIRVARYQCRECRWNGRRVFRRSFNPLELVPAAPDPAAAPAQQPADASSVPPETLPVDSKAAGGALIPAPPAPNGQDTSAKTAAEASRNEKSVQSPSQAAPVTADAANDSEPAQTITVIEKPDDARLPTHDSTKNAQRVEALTATGTSEVAQEQPPISGEKARIATIFGVNLREEPHEAAKLVGLLGPETVISLLQHGKQEDGNVWYYVKAGARTGWVCCTCLEEIG